MPCTAFSVQLYGALYLWEINLEIQHDPKAGSWLVVVIFAMNEMSCDVCAISHLQFC